MSLQRMVVVKLLADTKQFSKGMGKASGNAKTGMQKLGGAAKLGGLAVVAALGASVVAFAKFEDKLNQSISIMGDVSDTMRNELSDAAREVGKSTRFGADEAAESLFFLASAGLDAEQAIAAMPAVASFAQAGMFDLATATDLATDAQSALGLSVDEPVQNLENLVAVTDVLVKANTLANASVQQFSESLTNKAGSAIKILGKDMEEGVAVLAAFADQGVKGTEAGEKLNIVLRDLQVASLKNTDAWDELGLSVFDANGEMRNVADIVGGLEGALEGASDEQARLTLMTLGFQDRSVSALMTLLGSSQAIREYEAELRNAGGTTEDVAEKQLESFSAQMDLMKGKIQDVAIGIGSELAPGLLDAADGLVGLLEASGPVIGALGAIAGALGDVFSAAARGGNMVQAAFGSDDAKTLVRVEEAILNIHNAQKKGESVVDAYANSVRFLGEVGRNSTDALAALTDQAGLSDGEIRAALLTNLKHARSNGFAASQVAVLDQALKAQILTMEISEEEMVDLIEKYELTGNSSQQLTDSWMRQGDVALDLRNVYGQLVDEEGNLIDGTGRLIDAEGRLIDANGDLVNATGELIDEEGELIDVTAEAWEEVKTLAGMYQLAEDSQRGLAGAMREAVDPTFAAVKAVDRLRQAEADLVEMQKDGDATAGELAQAQLDVAEAVLEAQGALDEFSGAGVDEQVRIIGDALDIGDEAARELLETLGLIDGKRVTTTFHSRHVSSGSPIGRQEAAGIFKAHGGPVQANRPFIVGEDGPELFVPRGNGDIVPNSITTGDSGPSSNGGGIRDIVIQYPVHEENDLVAGVQRATTLAGLSISAETT